MGRVDGKVALVAVPVAASARRRRGFGARGCSGRVRRCRRRRGRSNGGADPRCRRPGERDPLDVRDRAAVDAAVAATVREFGRLDVLLDCAGVSHGGTFFDLDHSDWERVIAVNLTGMFHLGQAAARQMVRQGGGGSIINVTSQLAEVARPERVAYVASKGGGRSLTHAMALDLAAHGIRVNAIAPGPTLTGLTRASYADPERRRATIAQIPLGRLGDPQDLVGAILFLASDESIWATGSTVTVDGGYNAM